MKDLSSQGNQQKHESSYEPKEKAGIEALWLLALRNQGELSWATKDSATGFGSSLANTSGVNSVWFSVKAACQHTCSQWRPKIPQEMGLWTPTQNSTRYLRGSVEIPAYSTSSPLPPPPLYSTGDRIPTCFHQEKLN